MRRIIRGIIIGALIVVVATIPILAQLYVFLDVTESDGDSYTFLPIMADMNVTYLVSEGYIAANGTDTRVTDLDYYVLPHLLADDRLLWCGNVTGSTTTQFIFWTEQDYLANLPVITGWRGNVTVADNATLEPGNLWQFMIVAYVDTSAGDDKNIIRKDGAVFFNVTSDGVLCFNVTGGGSLTAYSIDSGYHVIIVCCDDDYMWLEIDDEIKQTVTASTIPNVAANWTLFENNVCPYVYYYGQWVATE